MSDRPILFSAPMVRALLAGLKTQTRRVLKPQPFDDGYFDGEIDCTFVPARASNLPACFRFGASAVGGGAVRTETWTPRVAVGDRLWVRETIDMGHTGYVICTCTYQADGTPVDLRPAPFWAGDQTRKLIPSIHMPRWASRLTLTVTEVRVQRLQDISEADAIAEGVRLMRDGGGVFVGRQGPGPMVTPWPTAVEAYADIWDSINGHRAWHLNPWVAAYTFTIEPRNIDASAREAA